MSTLPDLLRRRMASDGARVILRRKDRGIWKPTRWAELGDEVRTLVRALQADGFAPGMVGAVLADTRPEWVLADLALQSAGGVCAGLSPFSTAEEIAAQLGETGAHTVFVENEEQLDKVLELRAGSPALHRIVILDMKGLRELDDPMCVSFAAFVARGADAWDATIDALDPDAPAALVYTQDSTGPARPIRLSHRDLAVAIEAASRVFQPHAGDERLAVMPMSHVSERVLGLYLALHSGCISNYGESAGTLEENLREVKPTVLVAAPMSWKRFRDRVVLASAAATRLQRLLFRIGFAASTAGAEARAAGRRASPWAMVGAWLARLVLANVRRELGLSRLRLGLVAGGGVAPGLVRWFMALGVDPIALYGPPESAGFAAAAAPDAIRPDDVRAPDRAGRVASCLGRIDRASHREWLAPHRRCRRAGRGPADCARQAFQSGRAVGRTACAAGTDRACSLPFAHHRRCNGGWRRPAIHWLSAAARRRRGGGLGARDARAVRQLRGGWRTVPSCVACWPPRSTGSTPVLPKGNPIRVFRAIDRRLQDGDAEV